MLNVNGFCFQDNAGPKRKVDAEGCIMLNGILKVTGSYGETVSFSVEYEEQLLFEKEVQVGRRELKQAPNLEVNSAKHEDVPFRSPNGKMIDFQEEVQVGRRKLVQAPNLEVNSAEHEDEPFRSPKGKMIDFQDEPVSALLNYNLSDVKELHSDVERIGLLVRQQEQNLERLEEEKAFIEREISELQDRFQRQTTGHLGVFETNKEVIIEHIQMNNTAASVLCALPADVQCIHRKFVEFHCIMKSA